MYLKKMAVILYLEGLTYENISKHTGGTSQVAVFKWIDKTGIKKLVQNIRGEKSEIRSRKYPYNIYLRRAVSHRLTIGWGNDDAGSVLIKGKTIRKEVWVETTHLKRIALILYLVGHEIENLSEYLGKSRIAINYWMKKNGIKRLLEKLRLGNSEIRPKNYALDDFTGQPKFTNLLTIGWDKHHGESVLLKKL